MSLPTQTVLAFAAGAFLVSLLITCGVKKLARLDRPNHRSSHQTPTPTGGGLGIAICFLATLIYLGTSTAGMAFWACAGGVVLLAAISWIDDQVPLNPLIRLLVQSLAAASALPLLYHLDVNLLWWPGVVVAIMWLINLYNFMDGTDGLASTQALIFSLGTLLLFPSLDQPETLLLVAAGAAGLGFLLFNWPPASIFMGDVGSTVLGLTFGIILILITDSITTLASGLILLSGFITDASYTLCVRFLTGQRIWQAHRSHYYQKMARQRGTHYAPLLSYLIIGALVQWPLAFLAARAESQIWILYLVVAITVHGLLCVMYKAGCPDNTAHPARNAGNGHQ